MTLLYSIRELERNIWKDNLVGMGRGYSRNSSVMLFISWMCEVLVDPDIKYSYKHRTGSTTENGLIAKIK